MKNELDLAIEYGKSEHGFEFPLYEGKLLSWTLSLTLADEEQGCPKLRTVVRAMMERRPDQLARERNEMLKGSFDRIFGHNAKKVLAVIDEELARANELDLGTGLDQVTKWMPTCEECGDCSVHQFYNIDGTLQLAELIATNSSQSWIKRMCHPCWLEFQNRAFVTITRKDNTFTATCAF